MLCNADVKIPANGINCSGPGVPEKRGKHSGMPGGLELGVTCGATPPAVPMCPTRFILFSLPAALASHDYILKIVPTVYEDKNGKQRYSYQYTVANKVSGLEMD